MKSVRTAHLRGTLPRRPRTLPIVGTAMQLGWTIFLLLLVSPVAPLGVVKGESIRRWRRTLAYPRRGDHEFAHVVVGEVPAGGNET